MCCHCRHPPLGCASRHPPQISCCNLLYFLFFFGSLLFLPFCKFSPLRPRTRTLSVCLCRKQSLCVRHRCADPSLRRFHTTTESVCSLDLEQNLSLSQALCASLSLSLRRKYRCTDRSLLQHFHTSTASVLCILLGVRLPTTTKNKQSINSPY
jgi:hypothetical protein